MTSFWSPCTNLVTRLAWSTPTTPRPSWLLSTSGWTPRTSYSRKMTAEAFSNSTVRYLPFMVKSLLLLLVAGFVFLTFQALGAKIIYYAIHKLPPTTSAPPPLKHFYFCIIYVCVIFAVCSLPVAHCSLNPSSTHDII